MRSALSSVAANPSGLRHTTYQASVRLKHLPQLRRLRRVRTAWVSVAITKGSLRQPCAYMHATLHAPGQPTRLVVKHLAGHRPAQQGLQTVPVQVHDLGLLQRVRHRVLLACLRAPGLVG